jgi:hypothetical protein
MDAFSDRDLIRNTINNRNPTAEPNDIEAALNEVAQFHQSDAGQKLIIRFVIAEVVEQVFGRSLRGEYLAAVFSGKEG